MIVVNVILVIISIIVAALFFNSIEDRCKYKSKIYFKESLDDIGLPIITLSNNNKLFHFLIDSGASISVVDALALKDLEYTKLTAEGTVYGVDGNEIPVEYVNMKLSYGRNEYSDDFQVTRIHAFDNLLEANNVKISGILGNSFLNNYNCDISFKDRSIFIR